MVQNKQVFSKFRGVNCEVKKLLNDLDRDKDLEYLLCCDTNQRLLEILMRKQFHASKFEMLNDIHECHFRFEYELDEDRQKLESVLEDIKSMKNNFGICSFSKPYREDSRAQDLMWANYANGHKGLRIDFTINDDCIIEKVNYKEPICINNIFDQNDIHKRLIEIMTRKHKIWKYEREYRALKENCEKIKISIENIVIGRGFLPTIFDYTENGGFKGNLINFAKRIKQLVGDENLPIMAYKSKYSDELADVFERF